jgi:putative transposase
MGVAYMNSGQSIEFKNALYKFDRQIGNEWQLLNEKTHRAIHLTVDELQEKYVSGEIKFFTPRSKYVPDMLPQVGGSKIAAHLDLYPESEKEGMKIKRIFIESYLKKYGDLRSQNYLADGVKKLWSPAWGDPPHSATAARWLKRYIEAGRDIRSLGSSNFRKGNVRERYPSEVTEQCHRAITRIFLKMEKGSINATLDDAIKLINIENMVRPNGSKLPLPTKSYIKSLIGKIPAFEKHAKRYGQTAAVHLFRNAVHSTVCSRPLQRVEIDHTKLDIFVVDDQGIVLERPWLTLVIDVYSRAILGFNLSNDQPSHMTVARALKMALKPKVNLQQRWPSIKNNWLMFGCMESIVVDNGLEFHCESLEAACLMLGINISFCPRKTSWWKGHIERAIGTLSRAVTDGMPGRTFAGIKEKGDYNPVAAAAIPLKVMEEIVAKWIVDVYHETTHSTLGLKPRDAWEQSINPEDIPMVTNADELDAVLGVIATRTLSHKGIELNNLRYNSDELGDLRQQFGNIKEVTVKWDSEDLGYIHVLPPNGKTIRVSVIPSQAEYATGLTLYQHKASKAYSKKYFEGRDDIEALVEAKASIRELAENGMREASKNSRAINKRLLQEKKDKRSVPVASSNKSAVEPVMTNPANTTRSKFSPRLSDRQNHKDAFNEI